MSCDAPAIPKPAAGARRSSTTSGCFRSARTWLDLPRPRAISPSLRRANIWRRSDVTVRHTGYTDPAVRAGKWSATRPIFRTELAERPDDPFVLFNLGSIAIERQE